MSLFKTIKTSLGIEIERPPYEVLRKIGDNMEIRKYQRAKWVCTKEKDVAERILNHNGTMFNRLFRYISGDNESHQKIAMTSPVTFDYKNLNTDIIKPDSNCEMEMRFYVPQEFQNNPPKPTGNAFIVEDPEMTVACITFGGYASMNDYMNYRDILMRQLGEEAEQYDCNNIITAGYDPPFKPINRRNEVWLKKL